MMFAPLVSLQHSMYGSVNLVTLLFSTENYELHAAEIAEIWFVMYLSSLMRRITHCSPAALVTFDGILTPSV